MSMEEKHVFLPEDFVPYGAPVGEGEVLAGQPLTYLQDAWRRFRKNKVALGAAVLLLIIVLFTIVTPWLSPYEFTAQNLKSDCRNQPPSAEHWLVRTHWGGICLPAWQWADGCPLSLASAVL